MGGPSARFFVVVGAPCDERSAQRIVSAVLAARWALQAVCVALPVAAVCCT